MNKKYEFKSKRLRFRRWIEEDRKSFSILNADEAVMEFFPELLTKEESDLFVDKIEDHFNKYGYGLWAVELIENSRFIGYIGFFNAEFESEFTPCIEIGWRLSKEYWNKGYATEGAKACLNYGFNLLHFESVHSFTAKINTKSINVMEKIGLEKQSEFDHTKVDKNSNLKLHVLYKIDKTN